MDAAFARMEAALVEAEAFQRRARGLQRKKKVELAYRFMRFAAKLLADELVGDEEEEDYDEHSITYEEEQQEE